MPSAGGTAGAAAGAGAGVAVVAGCSERPHAVVAQTSTAAAITREVMRPPVLSISPLEGHMVYAFRALVVAALCLGCATVAHTQTLLESSAEARFQLDFHVPDAALMAMLPPGFTLNVATQGAAKDANVRVIF